MTQPIALTKLAKSHAASIELATDAEGVWVDAKSIVKVMAMKAPKDTTLLFRAKGEDAQEAVDALTRLVENDFVLED